MESPSGLMELEQNCTFLFFLVVKNSSKYPRPISGNTEIKRDVIMLLETF